MKKTLYLHIGTKKTGTTSIQHSMMSNIGKLEQQNFFVTKQFGDLMANGFFRLFNQPEDNVDQKAIDEAMIQFKHDVDEKSASGIHRTILSAESLTDLRPFGIELARKAISGIFDDVKIILYMRRQDLCATSHFATALRGGGTSKSLMSSKFGPGRRAVQYKKLTDDWGEAFGIENLMLRIFEKECLVNGNTVDDFYSLIGVDSSKLDKTPAMNTSFSPEALAFLRLYNETASGMEDLDPALNDQSRKQLVKVLESVSSGKGLKPTRQLAREYYKQFHAGNEFVRQKFFPERESLFNMDFSSYPEEETSIDDVATPEALMSQFVQVWTKNIADQGK